MEEKEMKKLVERVIQILWWVAGIGAMLIFLCSLSQVFALLATHKIRCLIIFLSMVAGAFTWWLSWILVACFLHTFKRIADNTEGLKSEKTKVRKGDKL